MEKPVEPIPSEFGLSDNEVEELDKEIEKIDESSVFDYFKISFKISFVILLIFHFLVDDINFSEGIFNYIGILISHILLLLFFLLFVISTLDSTFGKENHRRKKRDKFFLLNKNFHEYFSRREEYLEKNDNYILYQKRISVDFGETFRSPV